MFQFATLWLGSRRVDVPPNIQERGRSTFDRRRDPRACSTGEWFIQRSSEGGLTHVSWGWPGGGDIAVPTDYDGDGKADIAVYRGSTGEWFIQRSSDGQLTHTSWGCPSCGDVAVPKD